MRFTFASCLLLFSSPLWAAASASSTPLNYETVKPLLEKRCMVCHGCYDAPCQLKLTSATGLQRGANKEAVYDGERILSIQPTRLFIDAQTTAEWRQKAFYSVIGAEHPENSVLYRILQLKQQNPQPTSGVLPNTEELGLNRQEYCPKQEEFDDFAKNHPNWGMPYAMPNLPKQEYQTLLSWAKSGAPSQLDQLNADDLSALALDYERFLNQSSLKQRLMARYIYEHLFLGHLHFSDQTDRFYMLVRSKTPPGQPIDLIPTTRPYDDPQVDRVYYRLRPVTWSLVDKDHLVYEIDDRTLSHYTEWFLSGDSQVAALPGYDPVNATNPFKTFWQLPAIGRYQFMLDQAKFIIDGFIKGPVCRGQTALNVIEERFWILFFDPELDLISRDSQFLYQQADNLSLPSEEGIDTFRMLSVLTTYRQKQEAYLAAKKQKLQSRNEKVHHGEELIWQGNGSNKNALLTIFRNQDSATVMQGLWGSMPKTAWVIDYPLLERIQYLLVSGYDVYGNVGHQLNTRLYMDFLRMEGENNFLSFFPAAKRDAFRSYWYRNTSVEILKDHLSKTQSAIDFAINQKFDSTLFPFWFDNRKSDDVDNKTERLTDKAQTHELISAFFGHFFQQKKIADILNADVINRPKKLLTDTTEKYLHRLSQTKGVQASAWPNVSFLKVTYPQQTPRYFTLLLDKGFYNVASLFLDQKGRVKAEDKVTVLEGLHGSYPNQFFEIAVEELPQFVELASKVPNQKALGRWVKKYGIRRTNPDFWNYLDDLHDYARETRGDQFGLYDLNRYGND